MICRRRDGARARDERGAAMVEFALIAPIFLALVFGIISYGWMLSYRQGISQAAAEGARSIAVASTGASASQLASRARTAVDNSLNSYGVYCAASGALTHNGTAVGTCEITTAVQCGSAGGQCAKVAINHRYRDNPLLPSFPGLGVTLPADVGYETTAEVG